MNSIGQTEAQNPSTAQIDSLPTLDVLRLIHEQDEAAVRAVQQALPAIARAVDMIAKQLAQGGRLFYVGAGTSGRLGVLDAVECAPTFSVDAELVQGVLAGGLTAFTNAAEGIEDDAGAGKRDLQERGLTSTDVVVGIAASGRTPYVLGAFQYADEVGAQTVGIANNEPSAVLDAARFPIPLLTGAEAITGSTRMKAGTAQKMTLNMISTAVMIQLGKVYGNLMVDVKASNAKLRDRAARIVGQAASIDAELANQLLQSADFEVKTAIVMGKLKVSATEARQRLEAAKGFLRQVIG
ncbi:MAG: N-acetylmuramic acid 6-phosphate etherase [Anaerolineae bacterium]|nr:N-acetylmuramic acid 6-phosphate etherase [Anaerolineae bacterium]